MVSTAVVHLRSTAARLGWDARRDFDARDSIHDELGRDDSFRLSNIFLSVAHTRFFVISRALARWLACSLT